MKSAQLLYQYDVRIHLSQRYNQYDRTIRRRRADTHAGDAPHSAQAPPRAGRPPPHALPARAARSRACTHTDSPHTSGESSGFTFGVRIGACPTVGYRARSVGCGSAPAAARSRTREAYLINRSWNAAGVF